MGFGYGILDVLDYDINSVTSAHWNNNISQGQISVWTSTFLYIEKVSYPTRSDIHGGEYLFMYILTLKGVITGMALD
jgi:hypothetical protein